MPNCGAEWAERWQWIISRHSAHHPSNCAHSARGCGKHAHTPRQSLTEYVVLGAFEMREMHVCARLFLRFLSCENAGGIGDLAESAVGAGDGFSLIEHFLFLSRTVISHITLPRSPSSL